MQSEEVIPRRGVTRLEVPGASVVVQESHSRDEDVDLFRVEPETKDMAFEHGY